MTWTIKPVEGMLPTTWQLMKADKVVATIEGLSKRDALVFSTAPELLNLVRQLCGADGMSCMDKPDEMAPARGCKCWACAWARGAQVVLKKAEGK